MLKKKKIQNTQLLSKSKQKSKKKISLFFDLIEFLTCLGMFSAETVFYKQSNWHTDNTNFAISLPAVSCKE